MLSNVIIVCTFIALFIHVSNSFNRGLQAKIANHASTLSMADEDVDPNFEAHLPSLLKAGLQERPSPQLATLLRQRFKQITGVKKEAAIALKDINEELAAEVSKCMLYVTIYRKVPN